MPIPWDDLTFKEQAEEVILNVAGLTDDQIAEVYAEWAECIYPDMWGAKIEALADLQRIATMKLLGDKETARIDRMLAKLTEG